MYRTAINSLEQWKAAPGRKPLVIEGARQVGKTWLMKEFGKTHYKQTLVVNFDQDDTNSRATRIGGIFSQDLHPERIIAALELEYNTTINADTTLLIFDEIQEVPRALTSLKYFNEDAPQYHILAAGSQMGIALHQGSSFPVGNVSILKLHPLSFDEFLTATDRGRFVELLNAQDWQMITALKERYIQALKEYYFTGGMPEVVREFAQNQDFHKVRILQLELVKGYRRDYSKHANALLATRLQDLLSSIPRQLAKENKKFVWGAIRSGARSREYELAVQWLVDCAQAYKVANVELPFLPLATYCDQSAFKLYLHDVGLLGALCGSDPKSLLDGNDILREYRGTLTEQYVMQQLAYLIDNDPFATGPAYWTGTISEVDFIVQLGDLIVPIEVKATWNLKSKSLFAYIDKYRPKAAFRLSQWDYRLRDSFTELPLYALLHIGRLLPEQ